MYSFHSIAQHVLSISCLVCSLAAHAQENPEEKIIPPSPAAAALGTYGDQPVSYYTGAPSISIPIYAIQHGDISLPISLSYSASGFKVTEQASNIGLGWTLNVGGVITKTVKGLDDFATSGSYSYENKTNDDIHGLTAPTNGGVLIGDDLNRARNIATGVEDGEPDLHFFNFAGYSGKFIITGEGTFVFDRQELKIEKVAASVLNNYAWKVTDANGFVYEFNDIEITSPRLSLEKRDYVSSWYLSKITSPTGRELVFSYETDTQKIRTPDNRRESYKVPIDAGLLQVPSFIDATVSSSHTEVQEVYLKSIEYDNGYVLFDYTHGRLDKQYAQIGQLYSTGRALSKVTVMNASDDDPVTEAVLTADLTQSYFYNGTASFDNYRLKLTKLAINGKNYDFEYHNEDKLPSIYSSEQDHWGYFNDSGAQLLPDIDRSVLVANNPSTLKIDESTKTANPSTSDYGLLKKITYPTSGTTTFEYESHDYSKIKDVAVNEDVFDWEVAAGVRADTDPATDPSNIFALGYSSYFQISPSDIRTKIDINLSFDTFNENTDVRIEVIKPTFVPIPLQLPGEDPIDYSLYYVPDSIVSEEVIRTYQINGTGVSYALTDDFDLPSGGYFLKAVTIPFGSVASATLHKNTFVETLYKKPAGGARIKKITDHDGVSIANDKVRTFSYVSANNPSLSSGILVTAPSYLTYRLTYDRLLISESLSLYSPDLATCDGGGTAWYEVSGSSSVPLGATNGSHIGYERVEVRYTNFDDSKSNGKTIHHFTSPADFKDSPGIFPPSAGANKDMFRGKPLSVLDLDSNNDTVRVVSNNYLPETYQSFWGANLIYNFPYMTGATELNACTFSRAIYPINIAKSFLTSRTERVCQNNCATYYEQKTDYYYDQRAAVSPTKVHTFLTRQVSQTSNDRPRETQYKYPQDYAYITNSVLHKMVQANRLAVPVETVQSVNGEVVAATATQYEHIVADDLFVPKNILGLETAVPLDDFSLSTDGDTFSSYENKVTILSRDDLGNILSIQKENDLVSTYLWGYHQSFPVARIQNISSDQIASTAISNIRDHVYARSHDPDDVQTDINFLKSELSSIINDSNYLVTLYTYNPLVGMTSQTGPEGRTTFYEYDDLGRLKYLRDHDGNILERYEYKYKNATNY